MSDRYILDGHTPVPCDDLMKWGAWFERANRSVDTTSVGPMRVSTVFLGLDHSFGSGAPILFETMIFGMGDDEYQTRCSTWEEAEKMHRAAVDVATQRERLR